MKEVWIVFEYADPTNKLIGIFEDEVDAIACHAEDPTPRFIEKYEVQESSRKYKPGTREYEIHQFCLELSADQFLYYKGRYEDFKILDRKHKFNEFFAGKDYDIVQVHDIAPFTNDCGYKDFCGFAGDFSWKNNKLKSLDGDSYNEGMNVFGYNEFDKDGKHCLDIMVAEDW